MLLQIVSFSAYILSFLKFCTAYCTGEYSAASIFKTNDGTWRAQVSVKGKRKTKRGFSTKRDAQAWASELEHEVKEST